MIEKPSLRGMTTEQAIATLDKWIADTADKLNYTLSHLDDSNMVSEYVKKEDIAGIVKDLMKGD